MSELYVSEGAELALGQILEAFKRLEEGTFGLCVECGGEIPFERLFVMPEAGVCGGCGE